jgi:hypothetical protein
VRYVKAVFEKGGRVEGQGGVELVDTFHESGILECIVTKLK